MARKLTLGSVSATALILAGSAAIADVTAQDVWGDWRSYFGTLGYDVSATEETSGDTLTISNLSTSMVLPEDQGTFATVLNELSLRNNGDGTVTLSVPANSSMAFSVKGDEQVDGQIAMSHTGFNMVVSGDPKDMSYSYTAAKINLALASLMVDGQVLDDHAKFDLTMNGLIGLSKMQLGDLRNVAQKFSAEALTYTAAMSDPKGNGNASFSGAVKNLAFDGSGTIPLHMNMDAPEDLFSSGFAFAGSYSFGDSSNAFSFTDKGKSAQGSSSTAGGTVSVGMDAANISYNAQARNLAFDASGSDLPLPISAQMGELAFALKMPVAKSEQEQPFGVSFRLADLVVSDLLWSIFDAQAILPRDPATVAIDLSGTGKLFGNLTDPESMARNKVPGELNSLALNDLTLSLAGAKLTGGGDFTFDNSDLTSFDGLPRPKGAVDLQLVGGNGLIDKLVKMGLIPDNQAMQARMMLGLFAVPGDGTDSLKSKIEVNDQGHVLANGQRLK